MFIELLLCFNTDRLRCRQRTKCQNKHGRRQVQLSREGQELPPAVDVSWGTAKAPQDYQHPCGGHVELRHTPLGAFGHGDTLCPPLSYGSRHEGEGIIINLLAKFHTVSSFHPLTCWYFLSVQIATEGLRVDILPGISSHMAKFIRICMNEDPGKRPSFEQVLPILDKMRRWRWSELILLVVLFTFQSNPVPRNLPMNSSNTAPPPRLKLATFTSRYMQAAITSLSPISISLSADLMLHLNRSFNLYTASSSK